MHDVVIRGGTIVDGTGQPRYRGDIGISSGIIQELGTITDRARETIDAEGLIIAPGFIDIHTHYDAQAFWDSGLSPSPMHGVTTALGGNCGFTIAPLGTDPGADATYLMHMLASVEGMPIESLEVGVPWGEWVSFGEWLTLIGPSSINLGFSVGHSALRRAVMGAGAVGEEATADQISQMCRLLQQSLASGGLGFSSSNGVNHVDGAGDPVPSRWASYTEVVELSAVLQQFPGTFLGYNPSGKPEESEARMIGMSRAANRPLNWNVFVPIAGREMADEEQLATSTRAAQQDAGVVALTVPAPFTLRRSFLTGYGFHVIPEWENLFRMSVPDRIDALTSPDVRRRLRSAAAEVSARQRGMFAFDTYLVEEVFSPDNASALGSTVGEVADARGTDAFDTVLDIAVADELRTTFVQHAAGSDETTWAYRVGVWRDPRTVLGGSDAGAHLDMMAEYNYYTVMLQEAVRKRQLLDIEAAVQLLADRPARLFGLKHRGRLAAGWHADIVCFDPEEVGPQPVTTVSDLPGGASRLYGSSRGINHVFVAGIAIVRDGKPTEQRPGIVLRAGRDTETVTAASVAASIMARRSRRQ